MKILFRFLVLATMASFFAGCPYSSEVPIEQPEVKIDKQLLGEWESKNSEDYLYTVSKEDDFIFRIEKKSREDADDQTIYFAYLSEIEGTNFLNIYDESTPPVYYFYKMELSPSGARVTLSPVTENIDEKFTGSDELKEFFKKHKHLSFFYEKDEEVYLRVE